MKAAFTVMLIFILGGSACAQVPCAYNLENPLKIKLPKDLKEISGLSYNGADNSLYAISDDDGHLYRISLNQPIKIDNWKYHKSKDFEDVTVIGKHFYVLNSNGDIYDVRFKKKKTDELKDDKFGFPYGKGNEFEIMYYDESKGKLIIICKDCKADDKKQLSTYSFDPKTHQFSEESFVIDVSSLDKLVNVDKMKFKPSAAAINPITGKLFIISSINKLLVVADKMGRIEAAYPLDPDLYKQPEGLTFTKTGDMLISNEFHKQGHANILYFKPKN